MKMSILNKQSLTKGSSLVPVSSPVLGDEIKDNEQKVSVDLKALNAVLNRLADTKDSKESKEEKKDPESLQLKLGSPRTFPLGDVRARINYDFQITPATNSALATWQGISTYSDSQTSSYWANLFQWVQVEKAEIQLDFHQYMNMVGVADKFAAMAISYRPSTSAAVPGYTSITDDCTAKLVKWSQANPVFVYKVPAKWLKNVTYTITANMGVKVDIGLSKFAAVSGDYSRGYVHIASQDTFCAGTTGRSIIGRVVVQARFTGRV